MRTNLLFTVIDLIVIAFLIQLIPYGHNHTNPQKNVEPLWDRPDPQHVDEFQEVFDDGSMPPATYLLLHPEARLSIGERQTMFNGLTKLAAAIRCLV